MNPKTTIQLQFPVDGGSWTDVTHLVRAGSEEHYSAAMNSQRRSVVDSYSFALRHDKAVTDKFHSSTGKIFCTVDEYGGSRIFTGWIAPTATQHIGEVVEGLTLEALDMTYPLDEPLAESFQYPATVSGTAYKVLDTADSANSIVLQLLEMAGYAIATDVSPSCPDILDTIQSVSGEKGEEIYRDLLDDLLYEVGYTLGADAYGRFTVVAWDRDTVTPVKTLSSFGVRQRLRVRRVNQEEDGFECEWSQLDVMPGARLYNESLPISTTAGEAGPSGKAIADGDYFPPDSDIKDIFQRFRTEWLDTPYQLSKTRLRNPDLSLVNTSGHVTTITADTGVAVNSEEYEAHRGKVRIRNTSGATAKLYTFEIHGDALYRTDIRETLVPSGARNPKRYRSRFVFSEAHADRLAIAGSRLLRYGNYSYEFELREDLDPGEVYQIYQERENLTAIDTTVVILERRKRPDRPMRRYVAQAITAYSPETTVVVGSGGINRAAEDALREAREATTPSFADLDGGYDADSGGTTVPTPRTLTAASAVRGVALEWDKQLALTNLDHYEVQVSDDDGLSWYALDFNGLGTGAVDTMTSWPSEFLVHTRLPLDGLSDAPVAKAFTYRVRSVTKKNDVSAWSNEATAQSLPVGQGDLAADSIYGNNIRAGTIVAGNISPDAIAFPSDGLAAYYSFDDESAIDTSGNGLHGTITGASGVAGKSRRALAFNGSSDNIETPAILLDGPHTISVWANLASQSWAIGGGTIIGTGTGLTGGGLLLTGNIPANLTMGYGGGFAANHPVAAYIGALHHFCSVVTDTESRLYIDGALVDTTAGTRVDFTVTRMMRQYNIFYGTQYVEGVLDEVRIYDRDLTAAEVAQLFRFPGGVEPGVVDGEWLKDASIVADKMFVEDLAAINADLGTITAGVMRSVDWDVDAGVEFDLNSGRIRMGGSTSPAIDFNEATDEYVFRGSLFSSDGGSSINVANDDVSITADEEAGWIRLAGSVTTGQLVPASLMPRATSQLEVHSQTISASGTWAVPIGVHLMIVTSTYCRIDMYDPDLPGWYESGVPFGGGVVFSPPVLAQPGVRLRNATGIGNVVVRYITFSEIWTPT